MPQLQTFDCFQLDLGLGQHDFAVDTLKFCLTNTAPSLSADSVLADIDEVDLTDLVGTHEFTTISWSQGAGVAELVVGDVNEESSGTVGPFRWIVAYNDTTVGKPLVGLLDTGITQSIFDEKHLEIVQTPGTPFLKAQRG